MNIQDRIASLLSSSSTGIPIPVRACNFSVAFQFSTNDEPIELLLRSFDFPEAGVSYAMSAQSIYFPEPSITVSTVPISGYLLEPETLFETTGPSIRQNLLAMYSSQFTGGLLNINNRGFDATFKLHIPVEDPDSDDNLTELYDTLKGYYDEFKLKWLLKNSQDVIFDTGREQVEDKDIVHPLFVLKGCSLSVPVFKPNPASNEIVSVATNLSYRDFEYKF